MTNCGRCHLCGTVLITRPGRTTEYCAQCQTWRNYPAHGRPGRPAIFNPAIICPRDLLRDAAQEVPASHN